MSLNNNIDISIVIPIYNEEDNIHPLLDKLLLAMQEYKFEIVLIDDGSTDNTVDRVKSYHDQHHVKLYQFSRNFGQTSAMSAGIEKSNGKYIATIDGDLQNDPADIPKLMKILEEQQVDMVCGIRQKRQDGMFLRKIPSKIANFLIRKLTKVYLQDYGCTLKIFKSSIAKKLNLYGELHRFIPILAHMNGAKIIEVNVNHLPRIHGSSKYGLGRTTRVISDLLLMVFLLKFRQKPMHLFGTLGVLCFGISTAFTSYLLILKIMGYSITDKPLFYVTIILFIAAIQLITSGFIAELLMRTYFESQKKKPYEFKD